MTEFRIGVDHDQSLIVRTFYPESERDFFSHTFAHEPIRFEGIDDGIWSVWYGRFLIGRYDERKGVFRD